MNITIKPGAATEDASQIESIVSKIQECMETLDQAFKATIPSGIDTTWSNAVRENWETYYSADIPEAMEEMKLSATNLKLAVDQALKFDQEQK